MVRLAEQNKIKWTHICHAEQWPSPSSYLYRLLLVSKAHNEKKKENIYRYENRWKVN